MQYQRAVEGSTRKAHAGMELTRTIAHRMHLDNSVKLIGEFLFGLDMSLKILKAVRPAGQVLVDDWACLKSMIKDLQQFLPPVHTSSCASAQYMFYCTLLKYLTTLSCSKFNIPLCNDGYIWIA